MLMVKLYETLARPGRKSCVRNPMLDPRASVHLLPGAAEAARQELWGDTKAEEVINRVARLIEGFETPYGMELLASVHWVTTTVPGSPGDARVAIDAIRKWSPRKRHAFREDHIGKAWQRLKEHGWFTAAAPAAVHGPSESAR